MKVIILAGGLGTRISEETQVRPKPMVEIGGKPILWHIMKIYSSYGLNDFIVCLGYKGYMIKEYFANYFLHMSDVTFDMSNNTMQVLEKHAESWKVTLIDTGDETMTGGRLLFAKPYVGDSTFCFTYGDGLSDINIQDLLKFHKEQGMYATLTAAQPPGRFGAIDMNGNMISKFQEKPHGEGGWINGGFAVLEPQVFDYIEGPYTVWENEPLEGLARDGQLAAYRHTGFWQPMDTLRDKNKLNDMWLSKTAPWKVWK